MAVLGNEESRLELYKHGRSSLDCESAGWPAPDAPAIPAWSGWAARTGRRSCAAVSRRSRDCRRLSRRRDVLCAQRLFDHVAVIRRVAAARPGAIGGVLGAARAAAAPGAPTDAHGHVAAR